MAGSAGCRVRTRFACRKVPPRLLRPSPWRISTYVIVTRVFAQADITRVKLGVAGKAFRVEKRFDQFNRGG